MKASFSVNNLEKNDLKHSFMNPFTPLTSPTQHQSTNLIKYLISQNVERKELEYEYELGLKAKDEERKKLMINPNRKIMAFLIKITFNIIFKIASAVFQSFLSFGACICYVASTYLDGDREWYGTIFNYFFICYSFKGLIYL